MPDAQAPLVEVISIKTSTKTHYGVLVGTPTPTDDGVKLRGTVYYGPNEETMGMLFDNDIFGWDLVRVWADSAFRKLIGWEE